MPAVNEFELASHLAVALLVGLVVGMERGWRDRDMAEGRRVAGLRTFALVGLLGGVLGSGAGPFVGWTLAAGLVAMALLVTVSYRGAASTSGNLSITTAVAALLTYGLGALAAQGAHLLAIAGATVTAGLLNMKPVLHRWLQLIQYRELSAALQLLFLSVVVAPLLPNAGYGPYEALNPFLLWWAVVLIAGLSFAGHVAVRVVGAQRGLLLTGLLGGVASSTSATLALARQARADTALATPAAIGALAACGVMFIRMTVVLTILAPALVRHAGPALVAAGLALLIAAALGWRSAGAGAQGAQAPSAPPFDISTAVGFAVFLGAMSILGKAALAWAGPAALYGLSALTGLADVDGILVSVAGMSRSAELPPDTAVVSLGVAAATNMLLKAAVAWSIGGARMGRRVAAGYAAALVCGAVVAGLTLRS